MFTWVHAYWGYLGSRTATQTDIECLCNHVCVCVFTPLVRRDTHWGDEYRTSTPLQLSIV